MRAYTGLDCCVLDWYDGDTAYVDVDLPFGFAARAFDVKGRPQLKCRIIAINAPELRLLVDGHYQTNPAGYAALDYARKLIPPGTVTTCDSVRWDNYGGRWDGVLYLAGTTNTFAAAMLAAGQAEPYTA